MTSLALHDLQAGYGRVRVLDGVTLSLDGAECVTILGPNGSGKSTLAKAVMGLCSHHGGRIEWDGREIASRPTWLRVRSGLGYVPQSDTIFAELDVRENLLLAASRLDRRSGRSRVDQTLEHFPALAKRYGVRAGKLSGGERRMLGIGAALMTSPKLLILDEPTSDLSPAAIDIVLEHVARIRDELRLPLILIEQNVPRALELADRVCVVVAGRVMLERAADGVSEDELVDVFMEHV